MRLRWIAVVVALAACGGGAPRRLSDVEASVVAAHLVRTEDVHAVVADLPLRSHEGGHDYGVGVGGVLTGTGNDLRDVPIVDRRWGRQSDELHAPDGVYVVQAMALVFDHATDATRTVAATERLYHRRGRVGRFQLFTDDDERRRDAVAFLNTGRHVITIQISALGIDPLPTLRALLGPAARRAHGLG